MSRSPSTIPLKNNDPVPVGYVAVYALHGRWKGDRHPSASVYAMTPEALPHGGWTVQGAISEVVERIAVKRGGPYHTAAMPTG